MVTISTSRIFWPVVRGGAIAAALAFAGCGTLHTSRLYPELRDMPSVPTDTTPEAQREQIIKKLEQDRDNTQSGREPAVPPLPPKPAQSSSLEAALACDAAPSGPAVPALRGTLHGDWRGQPADIAGADQPGSGITGAVAGVATDSKGALVLGFLQDAATLSFTDTARLHQATTDFLLEGGTSISVMARGGIASAAETHRPLASLALGLKRAGAIVNALVADGISPSHIKIAAQGDEEIPAMAANDWSRAGPDGAIVIFEAPTP